MCADRRRNGFPAAPQLGQDVSARPALVTRGHLPRAPRTRALSPNSQAHGCPPEAPNPPSRSPMLLLVCPIADSGRLESLYAAMPHSRHLAHIVHDAITSATS